MKRRSESPTALEPFPALHVGKPSPSIPASSPHTGGAPLAETASAGVAALGAAIARGDQQALADLYRWKLGMVLHAARKLTGRDESFGLDVAQETFVRVINGRAALARLGSESELDGWLTALARSAAIDLLRRELRLAQRERQYGSRRPESTGFAERRADLEALHQRLSTLDDSDHHLLRMRAGGSTLAQIAESLGATIGTVHGRIRRALNTLSKNNKESDDE